MAVVTDIPTRGTEDGARQLLLLRAYLKDSDSANYKYSDALLIPILVGVEKVQAWRSLMGYPSTAVPFTNLITTHIGRVRLHVGDTTEVSLKRTDYEIMNILIKYPLRYVVALIKASETSNVKTEQTDPNHPLYILRATVDGQGVAASASAYADNVLADLLLTSGLNPFELSLNMFDTKVRATVSARANSTTAGSGFASLDGISFASDGAAESLTASQRVSDRQSLVSQMIASVYYKDPVYDVYVDGKSTVAQDDGGWYEL